MVKSANKNKGKNKLFYILIILIVLVAVLLIILKNPFEWNIGGNAVSSSEANHLKYYGYYFVFPKLQNVENYTNVMYLRNTQIWSYNNYSKHEGNNSNIKIFLAVDLTNDTSRWDKILSDTKTTLNSSGVLNKVLAIYIVDEPSKTRGWSNSLLKDAVTKTKKYFPDKKTFIVFNGAAIRENLSAPINLDWVGIDPYFQPNSTKGCEQKEKYDKVISPLLSWAKSSNKPIIIVGQGFQIHWKDPKLGFYPMPSLCQQNWYYETAKSEPKVIGLLWFMYLNANGYEIINGSQDFPDVLALHREIGKEILCGNKISCGVQGDMNNDKVVNIQDVILTLRVATGLDAFNFKADANNDGVVNMDDVTLVLRTAVGLPPDAKLTSDEAKIVTDYAKSAGFTAGSCGGTCSASQRQYTKSSGNVTSLCIDDTTCLSTKKIFTCKATYLSSCSLSLCGISKCISGYTFVSCSACGLGNYQRATCTKTYNTACSASPNCGNDAKVSEKAC